ncbi:MAG TPA: alpha/beta fold hydrolase, partial [Actinomycetota bacterium]|nr:alpha/beta fold hydrolase [Actinomycetota bacterium]
MASKSDRALGSLELVRQRVQSLPKRFRQESANGLSAEWELRVGGQPFSISIADHRCTVREGPGDTPQAIISTEPKTWLAIDEGLISGGQAFLERELVAQGNLDLAVRLETLFRRYRRAHRASDMDQLDVRADGLTLSCYALGKGDPILLLHGLGASKITWLPVLAPLAQRYRVIVPDLPGHGESDKPRNEYTPRFYARVVRHLMNALGIERAAVVGNSLGGRVAVELALRSPGRVAALALLDPSVPGLRWRYVMGFTRVFPTEIGAIPFPLRERWMEVMIRRLFAQPDRLPNEGYSSAAAEFIRIYRNPVARMAFFSTLRHIVTERPDSFFASLRRIKQPALIIFGDQDRLVPPRLGVRLAQHLPHSELVVLPDVGHVPQFEATDETLERLTGFLDRIPRREFRS